MTTLEFSDQFDVLYNNITSNQAPGLNEYEKSVFLTKAQDEIVLAYFNLFDRDLHIQADFSNLIRTISMFEVTSGNLTNIKGYTTFDPEAVIFYIPDDLKNKNVSGGNIDNQTGVTNFDDVLIIINEQVLLEDDQNNLLPNGIRQVIPITYDRWTELMSKPYKYPNKYQAWRLLEGRYNRVNDATALETFRRYVAIRMNPSDILNASVSTKEYVVRYVKKPQPIVLANFTSNGVSFSSDTTYTNVTECELDPIIHHLILQRAVELAKAAWANVAAQPAQLKQAE